MIKCIVLIFAVTIIFVDFNYSMYTSQKMLIKIKIILF